jgi:dihydrofolate synthase/folylpolyglutamate synthase
MDNYDGELMEYYEALDWLYGVNRFGPDRTLIPTRHLLHLMGNPEKKYKIIHIGGTNGKGSTSAYTASILQESGFKVGLFTSPHLEEFTERIRVNGKDISKANVAHILTSIRPFFERMLNYEVPLPLRFFDIVTALAFQYFADEEVEFAVVEVGLGGRLDATNVVDPLVSVITNIGYEHTNILGETLEEIAREKAEIIKPGRPAITATENVIVLEVFKYKAEKVGSKLIQVGKETNFEKLVGNMIRQEFNYEGMNSSYKSLVTPLLGSHQVLNASTAITAIEALGTYNIVIPEEAIRRGVMNVHWPARLEIVLEDPIVVLDCAKDAEATEAVRKTIERDFKTEKIIAIVSVSSDKNIPGMIKQISQIAQHFILTTHSVMGRAADPKRLADEVVKNGRTFEIIEDESSAFRRALELREYYNMVLVIGSVYLAGTARSFFKDLV